MAADTAQKRLSAMNIRCPWRRSGVLPSGTVDQAARQGALRMYSGILAGLPVEGDDVRYFKLSIGISIGK